MREVRGMAEIRKINFEKVTCKCKEEGKDFIPSNWYIDARKAWSVFAWSVVQMRNGGIIRRDSDVDDFIHKFWLYIEDHAVSVGEENEV